MAIRLTGTYGTTYLNQITVEIHDTDYTGDPGTMQMSANGLMEKTEGEHDVLIKTTNYTCTIFVNSEDTRAFFDALIEAEEGQFHLVVYRSSTLLFKGRIIADSMMLDDTHDPMFTFKAIDGLTLLRNVDYDTTLTPATPASVRYVILNCLAQSHVVQTMYDDADDLLCIASNLQFDDPYYDGVSFYENAYTPLYYYKLDGNKVEKMKAWDVLTEILSRFGLNIRYYKGVYYVFSAEFPGETWNAANGYTKDGTGTAILLPGTPVNIDNLVAYNGGKYQFENGLKSVQISAKKEYANAYFGETQIWPKSYTSYQNIGTFINGKEYKALITLDVTKLMLSATGPYPPFFSCKMWIKETNLSTLAVTYLRTTPQLTKHGFVTIYTLNNVGGTEDYNELAYILQTGKAELQFKVASAAYDRKIEIKFQFYQYLKYDYTVISGSPNVSELDYNYYVKAGEEPLSEAKDIYFQAKVDTNNTKTRNINILASDYYGNDLGKVFFWDGSGSIVKSNNRWRYANTESWEPLEPTICRKILEYNEANLVKLLIPCKMPYVTSENSSMPTVYVNRFIYKSETYFTTGIEIDHFNDIIRLSGVKINAKTSKTVTAYNVRANVTNPQGKETAGDTSNFGSYNEYQKGKTEVHVMDVVGDDLQIDYEIPTGSSFISIRQSIRVYVDGVRWRHVETLVTDNANRATYTLDDDGLIVFHPAIPNKKVIVDIENYFETGIST